VVGWRAYRKEQAIKVFFSRFADFFFFDIIAFLCFFAGYYWE